jgi:hypothetical protein
MSRIIRKIVFSLSRDIAFTKLTLSLTHARPIQTIFSFPARATGKDAWRADLSQDDQALLERLSEFLATIRDRFWSHGLFHEIICCRLRMFVPTDATGMTVLAKVMECHPITRISKREAA